MAGLLLLAWSLDVMVPSVQASPPSGAGPGGKSAPAAKKPAGPAVRFSGTFGFELIYDDNIIHYSDQDLQEFASIVVPGKYSIETAGDWIIRPRVDLVAETKALTGRTLEGLFRVSTWRYVENGIKNNSSFTFRLKHPGFQRDNFQLVLYYSPESYLRNFRDRPPFAPRSDPAQYTNFSYTSTYASLGYWRGLSAKLEGRLELRRAWRFYNQPFMENDNWEWRFGGYLGYRLARPLKVTVEYFTSDVNARARDEVGENAATSDNGDPSYKRDAYRVAFDVNWKNDPLKIDHFAVEGQYQAYYFTSRKPLAEDPTHVGRKDRNYQFEFTWDTPPVMGPASLVGGYRYMKRSSTAPGGAGGDESIDEDKDFTDNRTWIGVEVPF